MPSIAEIQNEIAEEFSFFDNWEQKYEYLIEIGKSLPGYEEDFRTDDILIKGCQSRVWIKAQAIDGKLILWADSDAILPKGIVALFIRLYHEQPLAAVAQIDDTFLHELGLSEFLSPIRANGTLAMLKQIKQYAIDFQKNN